MQINKILNENKKTLLNLGLFVISNLTINLFGKLDEASSLNLGKLTGDLVEITEIDCSKFSSEDSYLSCEEAKNSLLKVMANLKKNNLRDLANAKQGLKEVKENLSKIKVGVSKAEVNYLVALDELAKLNSIIERLNNRV